MSIPKDSPWNRLLEAFKQHDAYPKLVHHLNEEKQEGYAIFPPEHQRFRAFEETSYDTLKVVILGQDPYHGKGQAHGLAFSVSDETPLPPSLRNILKELHHDIGASAIIGGDLSSWAQQGVLLLNTVLSVREGQPGSHRGYGWEVFTDMVLEHISYNNKHLVFILWGNDAQKKAQLIDEGEHHIITAPHPSPLSAYRGFFGSRPFSETNTYLVNHDKEPIKW
jgi:uracil-DNA glycosylase